MPNVTKHKTLWITSTSGDHLIQHPVSATLEVKNYAEKLLFSIAFLNWNVFEQFWTIDSNKCHGVQYGVTRVQCKSEEKQPNGITCDLLTAEVIRVVHLVYEDWVISSWVDMRDMDMRNWFATVWSISFIIILKASRLRRTMKTATTVCATRCLIADINIVDVVEFYGRLWSVLYWKYFSEQLTTTQ